MNSESLELCDKLALRHAGYDDSRICVLRNRIAVYVWVVGF